MVLIPGAMFYSAHTKQKHIGDMPAMYSVVFIIRSPPMGLFDSIVPQKTAFVKRMNIPEMFFLLPSGAV